MRNGAQIRGRLVTPDHQLLANGVLVMTPEDSDGSASSIDGALVPDGSFVFENVPPGTYLMRALAQVRPNETSLFALFRVTVRNSDVDGMELVLRPGATISGQIIIDPRSGNRDPRSGDDTARSASLMEALVGVRVRAPLNDGGSFDDAPQTGHPARDGTFTVQGVMGGAHLLVLEGLPIPWCVKNVTYRGQDITDTGLQADSGQRLSDVSITVTDQASEVSGTVRDGDGRVVREARVLFVPVPAGLWPLASRRYARAITDTSGHYSVRGLPPGDYKVIAALQLADRDLYRRDILGAVRDQGLAITLETEQISVVDLSLIQLRLQHHQLATR
jgi:Carboxypeptidase regulatory-like domain